MLALGSVAGACGGGGGGGSSPTSPSPGPAPALASVPSTVSGRSVSISVAGTALANVGGAAATQNSLGGFLIARTAQDTFMAMTAICTHEQCTITGFSNGRFVCPCHGSQFTTTGAVAQGPATRNLQTFQTQFANGMLTFSA